MTSRWKKLLGDVQQMQGRLLLMVLALTLGLIGMGTILTAYTILTREIRINYLSTRPASAQLELDQVDAALVQQVAKQPGIRFAEASSTLNARIQATDGRWFPLRLFVVPDFQKLTLNHFAHETGASTPPTQTLLLERTSLTFLNAKLQDAFQVDAPHGGLHTLKVSGTVHDPGLAPAWQEQTVYGYITPQTLQTLGEDPALHLLKVEVAQQPENVQEIEKTMAGLSRWLQQQGRFVEQVQIPPPFKHPHQGQMNAVLVMFLLFSALTFLLSGILTATLISGLLAQQIRQIGIMKAIGGRTAQIAGLYLTLVATMGLLAVLVGVPLGNLAGQQFSGLIAELLNFNLTSHEVPLWALLIQIGAGLVLPVLLALGPILQTTRTTVLQALNNVGVEVRVPRTNWLDRWLGQLPGVDRTLTLSLRNAFRKRGRLGMTLTLLASAGALFLTSLNVRAAWEKNLQDAKADRHYQLEVRLEDFQPASLLQDLGKLPGVQTAEIWNSLPAAVGRKDGLSVVRTYPDGGHGSLGLRSLPAESTFVSWKVMQGRTLQKTDLGGVVLNHTAKAFFPQVNIGETLLLTVEGQPVKLKLLGVVREPITPSAAYVLPATFDRVLHTGGQFNTLRFQVQDGQLPAVMHSLEQEFITRKLPVKLALSEEMLEAAVNGHVYILIVALLVLSMVVAAVGLLGLASSMGTSVTERTREFGVMRSVGGTSRTILRSVTLEGVLVALLSVVGAVLLSLPLSYGVGTLIGTLSFRLPLPLVLSFTALLVWTLLVTGFAYLASLYPAWQASRLTVRETLSYL
ncbi:ABC transporter permease [Deinococcus roseus]|uniref:ABC3 transporter permease C-terminal domain-containing protein n=1 Tax=Deinococcus roseus TaxID=392414 RepID=A0ABQ2CZH8_9DEIO|nr:FtsX-like permease family protein [Deinococcus roseus]GGJ36394.1 hypothetical protein GCM10008938_23120 [Deinococcus roseus]